jgi:hypothetical protein
MLDLGEYEVDWRELAALDPGADSLDGVPLPAAPLDLFDFTSHSPLELLDADGVLDVIVAAERMVASAQAMQVRAMARFAQLRPSGL